MDFKCDICGAEFYYKRYLTAHKSRVHGMKSVMKAEIKTKEFSCYICDKLFSSKSTLSSHTTRIHNVKKLTIECKEEKCDKIFLTLSELRNHLGSDHGLPDITFCQNLEFVKYEDFEDWLVEEEKKSASKYVLSAATTRRDCKYMTFSCNRSGVYKPTTEYRQRQLKAQGTRKIGFHCVSAIKVKDFNSKIMVSYYSEHYKHSRDLSHLPIPTIEKEIIAGKLLQGIEKKQILEDIRKTSDGNIERKHLITIKDVNNIKQKLGLTGPLINPNNSLSIIAPTGADNSDDINLNQYELLKRDLAALTATINSSHNRDENIIAQVRQLLNTANHLLKIKSPTSLRCSTNSERVKTPHSSKKMKLAKPSSAEIIEKKAVLLKEVYCSHDSSLDHKY